MHADQIPTGKDAHLVRQALAQASRAETVPSCVATKRDQRWPSVPNYQLIREIHRGGQGLVLQALQTSTGRMVALKFLRHAALATEEERLRFDREVQLLARINDPLIVTVHDRGVTNDGHPFIVMDYIDGSPLDGYVAEAEPPLDELLELLGTIARGVHAAHLHGVIHRDLKPANILVDAEGRPHIVDFGLARAYDGRPGTPTVTQAGRFLGTLPWASPEQVRTQHGDLDVRTDVYSLGVIFWRVLTGAFPHPVGQGPHETILSICEAVPILPPNPTYPIDRDLETILRQCLAKEPARRYQAAGEIAVELDRRRQGQAINARRDHPLYVLGKAARRHWLISVLSVAMLLLTLFSAVGFAWLYTRADNARIEAERIVDTLRLGRFDPLPGLESFVDEFVDPHPDQRFIGRQPGVQRQRGGLVLQATSTGGASYWLDPTRRVLRGDFDIEVDFQLEEFPTLSTGMIKFGIALFDPYRRRAICFFGRVREHNPQCADFPEDCYHSILDTFRDCAGETHATSDLAGRLRVSRRDTQVFTYYWDQGWQLLQSGMITDDVVTFQLYADQLFCTTPVRGRITRLAVETAYPSEPKCLPDIQDEFAGSARDPRFKVIGKHEAVYETRGELILQKRNGSTGPVAYELDRTRWHLCGDFRVQVDFRLVDFPRPPKGSQFCGLALCSAADQQVLIDVRFTRSAGKPDHVTVSAGDERRAINCREESPAASLALRRIAGTIAPEGLDVPPGQIPTTKFTEPVYVRFYSDATDPARGNAVALERLTIDSAGPE